MYEIPEWNSDFMNFLRLCIYSSMYTTGRCQHDQAYGNLYRTVYGQNIYGQNIKNSLVLQLPKHMLFRVPSGFVPATRLWNWSKEMKWLILIWTEIFANCALSLPLSRCLSMNYIHSPYRLLVWFNTAKVCSLHPTACLSGLMAKVSSLAWVVA